jgi:hypothetical protein
MKLLWHELHMMERYKFEPRCNSSESSKEHQPAHPISNTSLTMKRLQLVDFNFLQELYDNRLQTINKGFAKS